jgi:hypothetical protein
LAAGSLGRGTRNSSSSLLLLLLLLLLVFFKLSCSNRCFVNDTDDEDDDVDVGDDRLETVDDKLGETDCDLFRTTFTTFGGSTVVEYRPLALLDSLTEIFCSSCSCFGFGFDNLGCVNASFFFTLSMAVCCCWSKNGDDLTTEETFCPK